MTLQIHNKKPAQPTAASLTPCYDQDYLQLQPHYTSTPLTFNIQARLDPKKSLCKLGKDTPSLRYLTFI